VEACGGTHVSNTGLIGPIKLIKTERIQDGVERIEFSAGEAAVKRWEERDELLNRSAEALRVSPEQLPDTVNRFFEEWKDLKKENERLKAELAEARVKAMMSEAVSINGLRVLSKKIPHADVDELIKAATEFSKNDDVVALLASDSGGVKLVVAAGERAQKMGVNSGAIVREMSKLVGGGGGGKPGIAQGGGTDASRIEEALERGVEMVREKVIKRDFYSQLHIIDFVKNSEHYNPSKEKLNEAKALNIFQTSKQKTWLVSTNERMYFILDDTTKDKPQVRRSIPKRELIDGNKVSIDIKTKKHTEKSGKVDIGPRIDWIYSKKLFDKLTIEESIKNLITKTML
jgi:hypothetical protein